MRKRNLVVLRCGRASLHPRWGASAAADWDLILCPYQEIHDPHPAFDVIPGDKWPGIYMFLSGTSLWRDYDHIWFPDDDIETDAETISRFFAHCQTRGAQLAAPALSQNSYFSHPITMVNTAFSWRQTSFVEIMVPCFARAFLETALPTFLFTRFGTGWALDNLWPAMLRYRDVYIIDETPMWHTRPVGQLRNEAAMARAMADYRGILDRFEIGAPVKSIQGLARDGTLHTDTDGTYFARFLGGYEYICARDPTFLKRLMPQELEPVEPAPETIRARRIQRALAYAGRKFGTLSHGRPSLVSSVGHASRSPDTAIEAAGGNDGLITGRRGFRTEFEPDPWWQVDLGAARPIGSVFVYNDLDRPEGCAYLRLLLSQDGVAWREVARKEDGRPFGGADGAPLTFTFAAPAAARFVRVQGLGTTSLQLDQVEVFGPAP